MILDDVLSGLDTNSEERLFTRLFGKTGLLCQLHTTVILVTNAVHRLSYADHLVALSPNGTIAEQGDFELLARSKGYIAGLIVNRAKESADEDVEDNPAQVVISGQESDNARDIAEADLNRPIGSWAIYKYYFRSIGWQRILIWGFLMLSYSLLMRFPGIGITTSAHAKLIFHRSLGQILDK